jgi:hypothetical protein
MDTPHIHLVSTLKNEGPWLVEWIAHYRLQGVTGFTLFSNDCTDGTNLVLNRLDRLRIVRHFDNPTGPGMDPQRRAYSRAARMAEVRAADWVLVVDADEFVAVRAGDGTLPALIDACGAPDAISIPWRLMGSAGQARMEDAPVTARFQRGSTFERPENGMVGGFKTLFRPASFDYFGVHRPRFQKQRESLPAVRWTNAAGRDIAEAYLSSGWRFGRDTMGHTHAQVNHYALKSREEFLLKKLRGTANSKDKARIDLSYWTTYDLNANEDRVLPLPGLEAEMARLLADPDLAALDRAAKDWAARTIAAQRQEPELAAFVETGQLPEAAE